SESRLDAWDRPESTKATVIVMILIMKHRTFLSKFKIHKCKKIFKTLLNEYKAALNNDFAQTKSILTSGIIR
ncbi:MAG: hypothetical protein ACU841_13480, partial [Gammaproteobacteria bacterium]